MRKSAGEIILTLTETNEMGAGTTSSQELPARPKSSTAKEKESSYKEWRIIILGLLAPLLKDNDKFVNSDGVTPKFIAHPDGVVRITVPEKHWKYLNVRQYKIARSLIRLTDECIKRWLTAGKIERAPPNCPINNPLLVAPKFDKEGNVCGIRICLDSRPINKYMNEDDVFNIPIIADEINRFANKKFFGEFDLAEAYTQFRVQPESRMFTAFTWQGEQYQFVGCPYGLKHIPSLFQRFMVRLFSDMPFVYPYIDNLPFASDTWEEHNLHARLIVERLNSVGIRIKPSSINLCNSEISILGHLIDSRGVHIDPSKQKAIMEWTLPYSGQELATVMGLGTFLRAHIRDYATITAPLEDLKKQKVIEWNDMTLRHWKLFKQAIATAPFLKFPNLNNPQGVAVDTSRTGVGGVLYEMSYNEKGELITDITPNNIIMIVSKKLNETQRRYFTYKQELWGLVYCLRKFHSWIWGHRDVTVFVDHRPLVHLLTQQTLSNALQSWIDVILNYDLKIQYRPGIMHVIPDALSRMYARAYRDRQTWGTLSNIQFLMCIRDMVAEANSTQNIIDAESSEVKIKDSLVSLKAPKEKRPHRFRLADGQSSSGGGSTHAPLHDNTHLHLDNNNSSSSVNDVTHYNEIENRFAQRD